MATEPAEIREPLSPAPPPPAPPRRWFRWRLSTLLMALAWVAVLITFFRSGQRIQEAERVIAQQRDEIARLHKEVGQLDVTDPLQVHVLGLFTLDENTWHWKVYLPAGEYQYVLASEQVPASGLEVGGSHVSGTWSVQTPQTVSCYLAVRPGADGQMQIVFDRGQSVSRNSINPSHLMLQPQRGWSTETIGVGELRTSDLAEPLCLLRLRCALPTPRDDGSTSFENSAEPVDGLFLLIERAAPPQ